jgi:hypothetical protein
MSRVYAIEESGKRHLVLIECDECEASIKPNPDIANSGWVKRGRDNGPGTEKVERDYCPRHA